MPVAFVAVVVVLVTSLVDCCVSPLTDKMPNHVLWFVLTGF